MLKGFTRKRRAVVIGSSCVAIVAATLTLVLAFSGAFAYQQPIKKVGMFPHPIYDKGGDTQILGKYAKYSQALLNNTTQFNSVPYWSGSFNYNGTNYPYQMVGPNPARGSTTTTIQSWIIPVKLTLGSTVLDGRAGQTATANSPLFLNSNYPQGRSTYESAIQRAEWWNYASHENYNVTLSYPAIQSVLYLTVPASRYQLLSVNGHTVANIDANWWSSVIVNNLIGRHTPTNVFPIFLTYNTVLYTGSNPSNCCILGYHSAEGYTNSNNVNTFAWGSYLSSGIFADGTQDVDGLSHEVAEWMNDPFTSNIVPNWSVPSAPQYGCNPYLEVGDPLVGTSFTVSTSGGTYHVQDEAFFSWFAHQTPSIGYLGRYSYLGTFTTPATTC